MCLSLTAPLDAGELAVGSADQYFPTVGWISGLRVMVCQPAEGGCSALFTKSATR